MNNQDYYYDEENCILHKRHPMDVAEVNFMVEQALMEQVDWTETTRVTIVCKHCGSENVVKNGLKDGRQHYICRNCGRRFSQTASLPGMRFPPHQIATALNMFYSGMSLTGIANQMDHDFGVKPSDATIYDWVVRFSQKAVNVLDGLTVNAGGTWVVDETVLRLDKRNAWFWDVIDDDTRFLVASHLTFTRNMQDAVAVLSKGQERTTSPPREIISDGLRAYPDAVERVFGADSQHIVGKGFTKEPNTNLIERFQGTIKQRTKVMRGMQNIETAKLVMDGWLVHYNFFRPHESLDNRTPGAVVRAPYPYQSWSDVVTEGFISTERRETSRKEV